jgi:hypothetical protein
MTYYMHRETGRVYGDDELAYGEAGDPMWIELEEYEPADEKDPCAAGIFHEGDYWRAHCKCGQVLDGANVSTREEALMALGEMLNS